MNRLCTCLAYLWSVLKQYNIRKKIRSKQHKAGFLTPTVLLTERRDIKMEHKCDENKLITIKEEGTLTIYKCPVCGKEICEIGTIPVYNGEPLSKCQIYIEWTDNMSLVSQIHILKKLVPNINNVSNNELLRSAKNGNRMKVGEMYLSEGRELVKKGRGEGILLFAEENS